MRREYGYLFKFILLGSSGSGKTTLLHRFVKDEYSPARDLTMGIEFEIKILNLFDNLIKLQIWDTSGLAMAREFNRNYYEGAHGLIFFYDLTSEDSFEGIKEIISDFIEHTGNRTCCKMLLGTKSDLENKRAIATHEGEAFANQHGMLFFEVSAKSGANIEKAFHSFTEQLYQRLVIDVEPEKDNESKQVESQKLFEKKKKGKSWSFSLRRKKQPLISDTLPKHKENVQTIENPKFAIINRDLYRAVNLGDIDDVKRFIEAGADVNHSCAEESNYTPLHQAAQLGRATMVEILLSAGAKIDPINDSGQTPLHVAQFGGQNLLQVLISAGASLKITDYSNRSPLYMAAYYGNRLAACNILIEAGADPNQADENGNTQLMIAAQHNNANVIKIFLKLGADPNQTNQDGYSALWLAACHGHAKSVEALLTALHIDIMLTPQSDKNKNALEIAKIQGHEKVVSLISNFMNKKIISLPPLVLLKEHSSSTADTLTKEQKDKNWSFNLRRKKQHKKNLQSIEDTELACNLYRAVKFGDINDVKRLIEEGANVNYSCTEEEHNSPLYKAAQFGRTAIIEILLSAGAQVDQVNRIAQTPLHAAASFGEKPSLKALIKAGAKLSNTDIFGRSPLYVAADHGNGFACDALIKAGADPNQSDENGNTQLMIAAQWNKEHVIQRLLELGADPNQANQDGYTALEIVKRQGREKAVSLISNFMNKKNISSRPSVLSKEHSSITADNLTKEQSDEDVSIANSDSEDDILSSDEEQKEKTNLLPNAILKLHSNNDIELVADSDSPLSKNPEHDEELKFIEGTLANSEKTLLSFLENKTPIENAVTEAQFQVQVQQRQLALLQEQVEKLHTTGHSSYIDVFALEGKISKIQEIVEEFMQIAQYKKEQDRQRNLIKQNQILWQFYTRFKQRFMQVTIGSDAKSNDFIAIAVNKKQMAFEALGNKVPLLGSLVSISVNATIDLYREKMIAKISDLFDDITTREMIIQKTALTIIQQSEVAQFLEAELSITDEATRRIRLTRAKTLANKIVDFLTEQIKQGKIINDVNQKSISEQLVDIFIANRDALLKESKLQKVKTKLSKETPQTPQSFSAELETSGLTDQKSGVKGKRTEKNTFNTEKKPENISDLLSRLAVVEEKFKESERARQEQQKKIAALEKRSASSAHAHSSEVEVGDQAMLYALERSSAARTSAGNQYGIFATTGQVATIEERLATIEEWVSIREEPPSERTSKRNLSEQREREALLKRDEGPLNSFG